MKLTTVNYFTQQQLSIYLSTGNKSGKFIIKDIINKSAPVCTKSPA